MPVCVRTCVWPLGSQLVSCGSPQPWFMVPLHLIRMLTVTPYWCTLFSSPIAYFWSYYVSKVSKLQARDEIVILIFVERFYRSMVTVGVTSYKLSARLWRGCNTCMKEAVDCSCAGLLEQKWNLCIICDGPDQDAAVHRFDSLMSSFKCHTWAPIIPHT